VGVLPILCIVRVLRARRAPGRSLPPVPGRGAGVQVGVVDQDIPAAGRSVGEVKRDRIRSWGKELAAPGSDASDGTSRRSFRASREPFLERGLAFTGMFAGQESLNADVLVELAPVDAVPSTD
jgi:hypothetical protein